MLSIWELSKSPKSWYTKSHMLLIKRLIWIVNPKDKKKFVLDNMDISMKDLCIKYKKELWFMKRYPV